MIDYTKEIDLVSRDSKGKLRVVCAAYGWDEEQHGYVIHRSTGTYMGKMIEQPELLITRGKVKRTVTEQVQLEFNSIIKKYKDKGYKELERSIDTYTEEDLNTIVGENATNQFGVLKPMLAKQEDKVTNRKIFEKEWWASRKIDGVRCLMYWDGKEIRTASRGGGDYDPSTSMIRNHPALIRYFEDHDHIILDGELYKHGKSLQQISGAARLEKTADSIDWIQYYVYDVIDLLDPSRPFSSRLEELGFMESTLPVEFDPNKEYSGEDLRVQIVPHVLVKGWDNMLKLHDQYVSEGFEGLVIRDPSRPYKPNGRTNDMIKIKHYQDAEFEITGLSEGLRDEDMCFTLVTEDGKEFKAKPMGSRELKQQYREDLGKLIGKMATVKFFYLSDEGTPLQPVLKAIRDYE